MDVSPPLMMDRVMQSQQDQTAQEVQIRVMKKSMDMQASAASALLNAVASPLPLAAEGPLGTQVNALV